jgi:hypothetical protein
MPTAHATSNLPPVTLDTYGRTVEAILNLDLYDPDDPDDTPERQAARIEAYARDLDKEAEPLVKRHAALEADGQGATGEAARIRQQAHLLVRQAHDMYRLARRLRALTGMTGVRETTGSTGTG